MAISMMNSTTNQDLYHNSKYPCVRVLYSYEYNEENGRRVWMKADEIFFLIHGVENQDWWNVCRPDNEHDTFYVPSSYVERVGSGNINTIDISPRSKGHSVSEPHNNDSIHNKGLTHLNSYDGSTGNLGTFSTAKVQMDPPEGSDNYMNVTLKANSNNKESFTVQYIPSKRPSELQDITEGDYANLEDFRAASNIPPLSNHQQQDPPSPQTPEGDYANLADLGMAEPSPPPTDGCEYQKTLLDTWEMYLDPHTNRIFYVHKDTKEAQWKPPRGQFHQQMKQQRTRSRSSGEYEDVEEVIPVAMPTRGKSRSVDYGVPRVPSLKVDIPFGWKHSINEMGEDVFRDSVTQEERSGGSSPAKSPTSEHADKDFTKPDSPPVESRPGLSQGPRLGHQVSDRFQKSRSVMLENLHLSTRLPSNTGPPPPKSATLPPNFSTPTYETEPIEGMLNKCRLINGKKGSKKWGPAYVKLTGTNLVFYKDQRSSQPKTGQPHGKSEQMLALRDCSVEKDPKEIGSKKKNIILINSPDGQTLLQSDDDAKITEWFLKLHMKIQELGGNPDGPAVDSPNELVPQDTQSSLSKKPSFKGTSKAGIKQQRVKHPLQNDVIFELPDLGRHGRNPSDGGNTLERKGRVQDVITKFLKTRTDKKDLMKKGIYKDAVFGADLKLVCEREKSKVPIFITRSIEAIEKRGLDHEGLYRIGGNISQIQKLRCMVDQGEKYDLHDPLWDINVLAGTLKLFFRELKEPLFTYALFDKFLKSFLKENAGERLKAIKATVYELPKCHFETVKLLFKHLTKCSILKDDADKNTSSVQLDLKYNPPKPLMILMEDYKRINRLSKIAET